MIVLVLNCGSSSIKYQVIDINDQNDTLLAKGLVDRIGLPDGRLTHKPVQRGCAGSYQEVDTKCDIGQAGVELDGVSRQYETCTTFAVLRMTDKCKLIMF